MQDTAEVGASDLIPESRHRSTMAERLEWPLAATFITVLSLLSWATLIWCAKTLF